MLHCGVMISYRTIWKKHTKREDKTMNLNIEMVKSKSGKECEISLIGRLDAQSAPEAEEFLLKQAQNFDSIFLNFSQLGYISSAGLRALKVLRIEMRRKGGTLTLKNVSTPVMEIFEMAGFAAFFNFA
ncbi:MAG: STAS domain-containing protein [Ruminococcaceae bacterium]|nr:STAS domain-containing protein [Oscillospiraceae bacterium]